MDDAVEKLNSSNIGKQKQKGHQSLCRKQLPRDSNAKDDCVLDANARKLAPNELKQETPANYRKEGATARNKKTTQKTPKTSKTP